eukprot:CAMPEP_0174724066 /NCGR_PEP_ID=MMETSP1094-20130205/42596_1 /TAXON_ID=156173 /ORGANISM="Chrysochromulina brevifilum, Strain UTEX LB 985" /LENGTH=47 /DNA_ID= /DNA_START= /DNA_END= /DNA_ORIENTATION=
MAGAATTEGSAPSADAANGSAAPRVDASTVRTGIDTKMVAETAGEMR